jgi:putative MFS transporter
VTDRGPPPDEHLPAAWQAQVPILRRLPALSRREVRFLGFLALANFFDHYDLSVLGLALPQIQASLQISEANLGPELGLMRLGALPILALTVLADRVGRRRLLLFTVLGFTVCTAGTAFTQTAAQFFALQFSARFFVGAEALLAVVVLTEELAASHRGFGIGLLGALAAAGTGVASLVFATINYLPYGWRALYIVGAVPLILVSWLRRGLPETLRYSRHAAMRSKGQGGLRGAFRPLLDAVRSRPRHAIALGLVTSFFEMSQATAYLFGAKHLQQTLGYGPERVTLLVVGGGALATLGAVYLGFVSDRVGRRATLTATIALSAVSILGFYNLGGYWVDVCWSTMIFASTATLSNLQVLGAELFPTSHRSTASGLRLALTTLGGACGLALEGVLFHTTGSHAAAISWLTPALVIPLPALWLLRETSSVELEHIAPEPP